MPPRNDDNDRDDDDDDDDGQNQFNVNNNQPPPPPPGFGGVAALNLPLPVPNPPAQQGCVLNFLRTLFNKKSDSNTASMDIEMMTVNTHELVNPFQEHNQNLMETDPITVSW